jgi:RimJ/RimL family protein N-acetyltransferase
VPVIETDRLILREWRDEDLPAFAQMNADPLVMQHMPRQLNREESDNLVDRFSGDFAAHGFGLWAVEIPEVADFAGFARLSRPSFESHFTPCIEVAWRFASSYWNRGYATEAARAATEHGFNNRKLPEIVSSTVPHNLASRRVMEKIGMSHDPSEDFDHPALAAGHPLRSHVLYRLTAM